MLEQGYEDGKVSDRVDEIKKFWNISINDLNSKIEKLENLHKAMKDAVQEIFRLNEYHNSITHWR